MDFLLQIAYFDCDNSDDSNSEYSFHLSAYEEDEDDNDHDHDHNEKTELNSTQDKLCDNLASICNSDCPNNVDPMLPNCQLCLLAENDSSSQQ